MMWGVDWIMDENNALYNAVGFAMRAGKLASGSFAVEKTVKSGRAKLIIVDDGASENTVKQWRNASLTQNIPLVQMSCMGKAIGKAERMVAAVTDEGFAEMILKKSGVEMEERNGKSERANEVVGGAVRCVPQSQPQSDERWISYEESRND